MHPDAGHIGQSLVASFVIAGAIAALVVMVALPKVGEELVLRHSIERLPAPDRAVTVVVAPDHLLGAKNGRPIFRFTVPQNTSVAVRYQTQHPVG